MPTPTTLKTASVTDIKDAVRLKCANCYGAMAMANAIGGSRTPGWDLCHGHSLKEILAEAKEQQIDLSGVKSAVDDKPVETTLYFQRAAGTITEAEFKTKFREWQEGK